MRAQIFTLAISAIAALSVLSGKPAAAFDWNSTPANLPAVIAAATNGDTIYVSAGTCSTHVTVNKTLNIRGAQADVPGSANTRGASETILANGVTVTANAVQLNGLVIRGGDGIGDTTGAGIFARSTTSFLTFTNNIVEQNTIGLYLNGLGHVVQYNLFRNNNRPGAASGDGIYSDAGLQSAIITHNSFQGNTSGSIVIVGGVKGAVVDDITISNNSIINDATIALFGSSNVTVSNNVVCNIANGHALMIGGSDSHISVSNNQFINSEYRGVRVSVGNNKYSANRDIRIYFNDFSDNRLGGLSVVDGAYVDSGTLFYDQNVDNKVDAECNAWGAISGPTNAANPGGTGDKVSGAADFQPFRRYITLTNTLSATLLQTYSNFTTHTFLQTVRITNNGGKTVYGPAFFVFDGFAASGITLDSATGVQDDECLPPTGSPLYEFLSSGYTLPPGQSKVIVLRFTTTPSATFNTTKIGGTDSGVTRRIFGAGYR